MALPSARAIALRDQVLAMLAEANGFPVSTTEIEGRIHTRPGEMLRVLHALERQGLIGSDRLEGYRCLFWRATRA